MDEKDLLLADFMEGKITEDELRTLYPDLTADIELIKLSMGALEKLPQVSSQAVIDIIPKRRSRVIRNYWLAAACLTLIVGIGWLVSNDHKKLQWTDSTSTDQQIVALWGEWNNVDKSEAKQRQLLEIATGNHNSNVRYLALEHFMQQPLALSQADLTKYLGNEKNLTNQIMWLELWIKLYHENDDEFKQWLDQEDINPLVKAYGEELIKNI